MFGIAEEHWHPLVVHFPVALWPTAFLFYLLSWIPTLGGLRHAAVLMGVLASAIGFLAIEAGERAAVIVGESICDQALLNAHNDQSHTAFTILSVCWGLALLYDILISRFFRKAAGSAFPNIIIILGLLLGNVFLFSAAHKGFKLVYFQQAAVQRQVPECTK